MADNDLIDQPIVDPTSITSQQSIEDVPALQPDSLSPDSLQHPTDPKNTFDPEHFDPTAEADELTKAE